MWRRTRPAPHRRHTARQAQGRMLRRAWLRSPPKMRGAALIAFCKSRRWTRVRSARRPGFVRCGSGFSLVRGGKGANKRFERNRTHCPRQLKMCFPRPKPEQPTLRAPSTAAIIRRGLRAGADSEMAFWKSQRWAYFEARNGLGLCAAGARLV